MTEQLADYFRLYLKLNAVLHCCSGKSNQLCMVDVTYQPNLIRSFTTVCVFASSGKTE